MQQNQAKSLFYEINEIVLMHKREVEGYLGFVQFSHDALSTKGSSLLYGDGDPFKVSPDLINTLNSTSYLLFYNSIESVVTKIVEFLSNKISSESKKITGFRVEIQKHWIKEILKLNDPNITTDKRLQQALKIINHFSNDNSLEIKIKKSSSNFDDDVIYKLFESIGISINLSRRLEEKLHKGYGDDSCLKYIKKQRNYLSHGKVSFNECGKDITINRLHEMSEIVFGYLEELEVHFRCYIDEKRYLLDLE